MVEDLARVARLAARESLRGWSADDASSTDRLADAIGDAVAACVARRAELEARHTADMMETSCRGLGPRVVPGP